jgi:glycosyltransferase involved in cell wall biosynthesis
MSPKILYIAPYGDFSGYAEAARNYISALYKAGCNLAIRRLSYDGGGESLTDEQKEMEAKDLRDVDIVLAHTTPNETEYKPGCFNVNYFAWETDRLPDEWVSQINQMELALVPCKENLLAARRSGVVIPMEVVEHTFDIDKYKVKHEPLSIPGANKTFKFLSICQYSKKKGVDALLKAYLSEFASDDNVCLVLKLYVGSHDGENEKRRVLQIIDAMKTILRLPKYPPIYLIHEVLDKTQIDRLYASCDAYALPSRGEGWGIPHFDAMGYGLPPIAVNWGGPTEFITKGCGWLVDYNMSPVCDMPHPHQFMYTAKDNWAEPHILSLRNAMRQAFDEWAIFKESGEKRTNWFWRVENCKFRAQDFDYQTVGTKMKDIIYNYYNIWKANNVR